MADKSYDDQCVALAKAVVATHPTISTDRVAGLENFLLAAIDEWIERQVEPCACCGNPSGNGDHSNCIFF